MVSFVLSVAQVIGLVALSSLGLLALVYSLQVLIRVLRHWNVKDPPPNLVKGKFGPFEFEVADVTIKIAAVVEEQGKKLEHIDGTLLKLFARVVELERGTKQIGGPQK